MSPEVWVGGTIGIIGSILLYVIQRWLTRGDREAKQIKAEAKHKQVVDDANLKLAGELRAELRRDNEELRERQRMTDQKLATTEGRLEDVLKANVTLHQDNLALTEKNGALNERTEAQGVQIKKLSEQVQTQAVQIIELQADRLILIDAMRKASIPIPPLTAERSLGTGPLGKG